MFRRRHQPWTVEDDLLDWFYVRYKHVYLVLGLCAVLVAGWGAYRLAAQIDPMLPAAPSGARFLVVDGAVTVRKAGHGDWIAAGRDTLLGRYDLIRTGPRGIAEILFPDQSVVHVRPDSLISLQGSERDTASGRQVAWHISAGEVFLRATTRAPAASAPPAAAFSTPAARGVLGESAEAALRVDRAGASELRQFAGSTHLETRSGAVLEVASAQAVQIDRSGRAAAKVSLPPPPDLLEPPHQAKVAGATTTAAKVLLSWKPVPGAGSYRLEMDRSAYFSGPFVDRRGLTDTSVEVRGLEHGQYYWRVASEGAPQLEGRFSEYARLTVAAPEEARRAPPPPLDLENLELSSTDILHVKGTTAPGTSVTVNGRRL
ncbi:MAG TPA: hypothetical protein VF310_16190, partial [Vicinamibacteria bacterium]